NALGRDDLWLFTSAQAIDHLCACLPEQDWAQARAMATHPRIAMQARAAGFGVVWESRPALDDIAASIKSLR
ncbi:MAG: uroporphyrinogen-III synthase, partial [Burkholderiaceae bacterium]